MADTKINSAGERQPVDEKSRYAEMSAIEMSRELAQEIDDAKRPFININLFAANYSNQSVKELNKSIRSHEKQIEKHKYKIAHPQEFYKDWALFSKKKQEGCLDRWKKEIGNFKNQIAHINKELEKRGK